MSPGGSQASAGEGFTDWQSLQYWYWYWQLPIG